MIKKCDSTRSADHPRTPSAQHPPIRSTIWFGSKEEEGGFLPHNSPSGFVLQGAMLEEIPGSVVQKGLRCSSTGTGVVFEPSRGSLATQPPPFLTVSFSRLVGAAH